MSGWCELLLLCLAAALRFSAAALGSLGTESLATRCDLTPRLSLSNALYPLLPNEFASISASEPILGIDIVWCPGCLSDFAVETRGIKTCSLATLPTI